MVPSNAAANLVLRQLLRGQFIRDVAKVATGTAAAQAITFAFYPVTARIYGPEAFGVLGLFMSLVAVLTPIAGLTYPLAIVLPKSDKDAKGLVRLSMTIAVLISVVITIALTVVSELIISLFGLERIASFIFLLPLVIVFTTMLATAQQWSTRTKQFTLTASVAVLQAAIVNVSKVGLGLVQPLASTLIAISTAGIAIHSGMLTFGNRRKGVVREDPALEAPEKSLTELARIYRDFPLFRAPQELLNALGHGLPVILLAGFYGTTVAGFYALAYSVLAAPSSLISASVGNVLYPRLAEAANRGEDLQRMVLLPTGALLIIGFIPFGTIMLVGPLLFSFVFGDEWRESGEYARWLALWLLAGFVNTPSVKAIPVISEQKRYILFGATSACLRTSSVLAAYYLGLDQINAMMFVSLSGTILNISLIMLVFYGIRRYNHRSME